jgi:hypothetical protein
MEHYPLSQEKIEALKNSIGKTGFWAGVQARKEGEASYEIAFGHHRVEAARQMGITEIPLEVRQFSNDMMIQMMADENLGDWQHDAGVQIATIESVLEAAGKGEITLPPVDAMARSLRTVNGAQGVEYNAQTIATYLGANWTQQRVHEILKTLDELGSNASEVFQGVKPSVAAEIVRSAKKQATDGGEVDEGKKLRLIDKYVAMAQAGERGMVDKVRKDAGIQPTRPAPKVSTGSPIGDFVAGLDAVLVNDGLSKLYMQVKDVPLEGAEELAITSALRELASRASEMALEFEGVIEALAIGVA